MSHLWDSHERGAGESVDDIAIPKIMIIAYTLDRRQPLLVPEILLKGLPIHPEPARCRTGLQDTAVVIYDWRSELNARQWRDEFSVLRNLRLDMR